MPQAWRIMGGRPGRNWLVRQRTGNGRILAWPVGTAGDYMSTLFILPQGAPIQTSKCHLFLGCFFVFSAVGWNLLLLFQFCFGVWFLCRGGSFTRKK